MWQEEIAPGYFVSDLVPSGQVTCLQAGLFFGHAGFVVAVHPHDWRQLSGTERERLRDELTRAEANRGIRLIEAALRDVDA